MVKELAMIGAFDGRTEQIRAVIDQIIEAAPTSEEELLATLAKLGWDYLQRQWYMVVIVGALSGVGHEVGRLTFAQALKLIARLREARDRASEGGAPRGAFHGPWGPQPESSAWAQVRKSAPVAGLADLLGTR
jgi:hypothetical protein